MDKSYLKGKAELQNLREQSPEDRALSNVGKIRTTMNNIEDNRFENMSALSGSFYVKNREDKPGFNFGIWMLSQIEIEEQTLVPFSKPAAVRNRRTPVLLRSGQQTAKGYSGQALTSQWATQLSCKAPGFCLCTLAACLTSPSVCAQPLCLREAGCWAGLVEISLRQGAKEQQLCKGCCNNWRAALLEIQNCHGKGSYFCVSLLKVSLLWPCLGNQNLL